jgi:hypothetical protein
VGAPRIFKVSINLATDAAQVICGGPCKLHGIYVDTALSAHACPILDGAVTVFSLVASLAVGSKLNFDGMLFESSLELNSNDAATGIVVISYEPMPAVFGSTDTI